MKKGIMIKCLPILYSFVFLLICLSGCKEEATVAVVKLDNNDLEGHWTMLEAYKENKASRMLNKGYFTFEKGQFKTNILGDEKSYPFLIDNNLIRINDKSKNVYRVSMLTSDTLIMTAKLSKFNFKFITLKSVKP